MRKFLYIFLTFLFVLELSASNGGSLYTRYGTGDLQYSFSARRLSLGELGAAYFDRNYLSYYNPASWAGLTLTRFEAGVNFKGLDIKDNSNSAFYSDAQFSGFLVGFPISKAYGVTLTLGLMPYSHTKYSVTAEETNPGLGTYTSKFQGNGGLYKYVIGTTYSTPFYFTLGASFEYFTGKSEFNSNLDFPANSNLGDSFYQKRYSYKGLGTTIGLISNDFSNILGESQISNLRVGALFSYSPELQTDTTIFAQTTVGTDTLSFGNVKTNLPIKMGVGLAFTINKKHNLSLDYLLQPWSNYKFNGKKSPLLNDLYKISLGYEFNNLASQFSSFWEQIILRAGLSYEQTQYKIYGESINQFSVHGGFSLPLSIANTLDFGFMYGIRGTNANGLMKENIYRMSVSFSFGDLWFIREER